MDTVHSMLWHVFVEESYLLLNSRPVNQEIGDDFHHVWMQVPHQLAKAPLAL